MEFECEVPSFQNQNLVRGPVGVPKHLSLINVKQEA
jgi:hypothetical protein